MNAIKQKEEYAPRNNNEPPNMVMPRFVRLNPRFDRQESLDLLQVRESTRFSPSIIVIFIILLTSCIQSEIKSTHPDNTYPLQVAWLLAQKQGLEFFLIPGDFSLNKTISFQSGRVYGMDVTSGAAVAVLLMDVYDDSALNKDFDPKVNKKPLRVLDLCCAPG